MHLGGESPLRAVMTGTASLGKGAHREVGSDGSWRRNPDSTNRNRIRSRPGGVTRHWTGRPKSHSDTPVGKSGGDRGKDAGLTLGGLRDRLPGGGLPQRQRSGKGAEKSAEAIVVPTSRDEGPNSLLQGASREDSMGVERQQGRAYQLSLFEGEEGAVRPGVSGEGGTGTAAYEECRPSAIVGNQHKWDSLGPERSGVWKSLGELLEGPVMKSSPVDVLGLHLGGCGLADF